MAPQGENPRVRGADHVAGHGYLHPRENPRVRGADATGFATALSTLGEPPRARGRPTSRPQSSEPPGRTPACAGPTNLEGMTWQSTRENPRVRGADESRDWAGTRTRGEPPRARGRHIRRPAPDDPCGRTPACAGPTDQHGQGQAPHRENPRVRGADGGHLSIYAARDGEPPRARGRREWPPACTPGARRTPACAGPTPGWHHLEPGPGENPRVRGADGRNSPHGESGGRRTPACAGPTFRAWLGC